MRTQTFEEMTMVLPSSPALAGLDADGAQVGDFVDDQGADDERGVEEFVSRVAFEDEYAEAAGLVPTFGDELLAGDHASDETLAGCAGVGDPGAVAVGLMHALAGASVGGSLEQDLGAWADAVAEAQADADEEGGYDLEGDELGADDEHPLLVQQRAQWKALEGPLDEVLGLEVIE